jgi:hypothetical protein
MNTLHLSLKKRWFEMIACGEKKEEYREIKDYWTTRFVASIIAGKPIGNELSEIIKRGEYLSLSHKKFDRIYAKNGYSKTSPIIHWEHLGITIGEPNPSWCEPQNVGKKVFILKIGDIFYDSRK